MSLFHVVFDSSCCTKATSLYRCVPVVVSVSSYCLLYLSVYVRSCDIKLYCTLDYEHFIKALVSNKPIKLHFHQLTSAQFQTTKETALWWCIIKLRPHNILLW